MMSLESPSLMSAVPDGPTRNMFVVCRASERILDALDDPKAAEEKYGPFSMFVFITHFEFQIYLFTFYT